MAKYIFVTGGVVSSLGKGITAASIGRLLKSRGYSVSVLKFDPYINVDPGTMSPYQHGEVFVTDDGAEADLDLGHYERFIDINLSKLNNVTTGKIYWSIINKERRGEYQGGTVQVIPHVTNEIKARIHQVAEQTDADVIIVEVGGTVGDIESLPFLEAIRQFRTDVGRDSAMYIHVTLVPYVKTAGELKTKPTQHSVKELRSIGIQPDLIVCRSDQPLSKDMREKIALFCDTSPEAVISNPDANHIYAVPLLFATEGVDELILQRLGLPLRSPDLTDWGQMVKQLEAAEGEVEIALVGKYIELHDAYLSVVEALRHGGIANGVNVKIRWIHADDLDQASQQEVAQKLAGVQGVIIPGGFGFRGIEGKINSIRWAREEKVPFFGICLGMQCAVIEFARNVAGMADAQSTEFKPETPFPVIDLLPEDNQKETMRLGLYPAVLAPEGLAFKAYNEEIIYERHRHRYEVNNTYRNDLTEAGLILSGVSPDQNLVEIIELADHPWFLGCQFHPEFKSRPNRPHPLFRDFIKAALQQK